MKNTYLLIFTILVIILLSCGKEDPLILDMPEDDVRDNILIVFENDTIKFQTANCINDNKLVGSLISVAIREDSFGIDRQTIIYTKDTISCDINKLHIGFDITDKIVNYPVTKEIMEKHLDQIQNKTSISSRLEVKFSNDCYTYQNFERIFNDSIQLYNFSRNDNFDYAIEKYAIINGSECGYRPGYFLVELEGRFSGYLYTTPNVLNRDSVFIECQNFKIRILHDLNN